MKSSSTNAESVELKLNTDAASAPRAMAEGDVQKKITPWTNPGSVAAELFPGSGSTALSNAQHPSPPSDDNIAGERGGLVLVASLLNKIPNLGGEGCPHTSGYVVVCPQLPLIIICIRLFVQPGASQITPILQSVYLVLLHFELELKRKR